MRVLGVAVGAPAALAALTACASPQAAPASASAPPLPHAEAAPTTIAQVQSQLAAALGQGAPAGRRVDAAPVRGMSGADAQQMDCRTGWTRSTVSGSVAVPDDHGDAVRAYLTALGWTVNPWERTPDLPTAKREFTATYRGAELNVADFPANAIQSGEQLLAMAYTPCAPHGR